MPKEDYTTYVLRYGSTRCEAEKALILQSLRAERHSRLTIAVNLTTEKAHTEANRHYSGYVEASKALKALTGSTVYDRYRGGK